MIKRPVALFLAITMIAVFTLTACGGNEPENFQPDFGSQSHGSNTGTSGNNEPQNTGDNNESGLQNPDSNSNESLLKDVFFFKVGNVLIEMDHDITDILAGLGEPRGILERPSCAFDGMDIIYGYPDFEIYTYPKNGNNHVHTIVFLNDSPKTAEGEIHLEATLQDVFDAYGTEYEYNNGMYTFTRGLTTLQFYIENDIVWGVTYGFIIE